MVKPLLRGWLHLGMFPLALLGGLVLVALAGSTTERVVTVVFTVCTSALFGVSATYHRGRWTERTRVLMKRLDHSSIFLLIAGSYTPYAVLLLPTDQARLLLGLVWGGAVLGILAGGLGGWWDTGVMRFVDILLSIPSLLLAVSIAAVLGRTPWAIMIAIGIAQVPIFARLLRGSMLGQRGQDYVLAASSLGLRQRRIVMSHVLPNSLGPLIVQATLVLATIT